MKINSDCFEFEVAEASSGKLCFTLAWNLTDLPAYDFKQPTSVEHLDELITLLQNSREIIKNNYLEIDGAYYVK